jgi:hypothetical protein
VAGSCTIATTYKYLKLHQSVSYSVLSTCIIHFLLQISHIDKIISSKLSVSGHVKNKDKYSSVRIYTDKVHI